MIDVVNVRACKINHYSAYGFWAPAIGDYTRHKIHERLDTPQYAELLKIWCDGLLSQLIDDTPDPKLRGALRCPACGIIHGRCHDALYPMMHLAHATGDAKYLDAAIKLQAWSDNVTLPTGEFTNDLDPNSPDLHRSGPVWSHPR